MTHPIVRLANGQPAHTRRATDFVTFSMIRQHGSFSAALAWLNAARASASMKEVNDVRD